MSLELHRKSFELVSMTYLKEKSTARQQNFFRAPKNRDASILLGKHIANAMIFSTVFDRFRAPRSIEASASIDSASKKRRSISVQKCTARQQKIVRAPKTAMPRSIAVLENGRKSHSVCYMSANFRLLSSIVRF